MENDCGSFRNSLYLCDKWYLLASVCLIEMSGNWTWANCRVNCGKLLAHVVDCSQQDICSQTFFKNLWRLSPEPKNREKSKTSDPAEPVSSWEPLRGFDVFINKIRNEAAHRWRSRLDCAIPIKPPTSSPFSLPSEIRVIVNLVHLMGPGIAQQRKWRKRDRERKPVGRSVSHERGCHLQQSALESWKSIIGTV